MQKALSYRLRADGERKLLQVCENQTDLYERVVPWMGLVREDVHGVPVVFPEGSVYVTEGTTRRSTGTHYTPRRLTEEVVKYTLEPLVYAGPAEGLPREAWTLRAAKDLLALRVCDLAMGSGAFLVQVCRYLAERLVEAWEAAERAAGGGLVVTPEGELTASDPRERALPADVEERLALARRYVADRCLYGVDINPMAVEMAKLSLWLVTLQRDRPFTFVDHALRCGDSLLGATELRHLEDYTLRPSPRPDRAEDPPPCRGASRRGGGPRGGRPAGGAGAARARWQGLRGCPRRRRGYREGAAGRGARAGSCDGGATARGAAAVPLGCGVPEVAERGGFDAVVGNPRSAADRS
ncbi:MAG: hypothetical protein IPF99_32045 [Deltaproteobacteria bacterium]|nr:hypothetical protein [Deltaproteobacteria bacterium]